MSMGYGTTLLPAALLRKYIKVSFVICSYLLCHTALTNKLNYQNQKVATAVCKSRVILAVEENCILPHR